MWFVLSLVKVCFTVDSVSHNHKAKNEVKKLSHPSTSVRVKLKVRLVLLLWPWCTEPIIGRLTRTTKWLLCVFVGRLWTWLLKNVLLCFLVAEYFACFVGICKYRNHWNIESCKVMERFLSKRDKYVRSFPAAPSVITQADLENWGLNNVTLRHYQLEGLNWLARRYGPTRGCIIGDEMGLGKTLQSISLILYVLKGRKLTGRVLVVCPLSVMNNWQEELLRWWGLGDSCHVMVIIYRFTPSLKVINMLGSKEEREEKRRAILEQVSCWKHYMHMRGPQLAVYLVEDRSKSVIYLLFLAVAGFWTSTFKIFRR